MAGFILGVQPPIGALVYLLLKKTLGYRPRLRDMDFFLQNFFRNGVLLGVYMDILWGEKNDAYFYSEAILSNVMT